MFIKGEKCFLRGVEFADCEGPYLSWLNDHEVTSGLVSGLFPTTLNQLELYVQNINKSNSALFLAICDLKTSSHIGNIKLDSFDWVGRTAELGILIGDKTFWGKGIGEEACSLIIHYAKHYLNLRKVTLSVFTNNPRAEKLYLKLGFQVEGRLVDHIYYSGQYYDKVYMSKFLN